MKDWKFHCAVLEVKEDASLKDVRKAYRRLALERHPDMHNGSHESHEAFQQLNESYKHVAAALIEGYVPPPPPPQYGNYSGSSKPIQPSEQPEPRVAPARSLKPPKGFPRVWIHAGVACGILLVISLFFERPGSVAPTLNRDYKPDLFPKAWCFVNNIENGASTQEVAELWTQRKCEEKCESIAAQKDVSCEWSGDRFRTARGMLAPSTAPAPAVPPPFAEAARASCEISIEKTSGITSTPYRNATEASCKSVCSEMMKEKSMDGVRCTWDGAEFSRQAMKKPAKETWAGEPGNVKATQNQGGRLVKVQEQPIGTQRFFGDHSVSFRSTCFMSVISENGVSAEPIADETFASCEKRCIDEVNAHPTGREVECSFAGKQIIKYVPDPMVSYMARDPAGTGFMQGKDFFATCQINGRVGKLTTRLYQDVNTSSQCASYCESEFRKTPKGTEIVCSFNGETFFQEVASRQP